jgi:cyclophilin family peptidyl-prolyl cis-trans isomerase/serine/threonine protein kinase
MAGPRPLRSTDPRRIGAYELLARLGEGGQGTVFLARGDDGVRVAVKLLRAEVVDDPRARRFLERELTAVERVAPFCTARILAFHADGDAPHLVSEYVAGPSLQEHVVENGPFTGPALTTLAIGTATALAAIHEAGVVHRDFKPANVLLGPDGPRVIDFGVARPLDATAATVSQAVGTPAYMSPEQLAGDPAGPPMDLFAWACTMVFAASGRLAFAGVTAPSVINRIMNGEPDLDPLTGPLRDLATACLAKDPSARPTATDVLLHLLGDNTPGDLLTQGATTAATLVPRPAQSQPPAAADPPSAGPHQAATPPYDNQPAVPGTPPYTPEPAAAGRNEAGPHQAATPPYDNQPAVPSTPPYTPEPAAAGRYDSGPHQAGAPYGTWPRGVGGAPYGMRPGGAPYATAPGGAGGRRRGRVWLAVAGAAGGVLLVAGGVTAAVLLSKGDGAPIARADTNSPLAHSSSPATSETATPVRGRCVYGRATSTKVKQTGTPPAQPAVSGTVPVTLRTNAGGIALRLDAGKAPCTVNSFVYLAKSGFYDNTKCHRLTTAAELKVLQCGDPTGTGTGGPSYSFADEDLTAAAYTRGTVAMANAGPNTNGSQFFILYGDAPTLPKSYTVFGRVAGGMGIVDKVAAGGANDTNAAGDGTPKIPITIEGVTT